MAESYTTHVINPPFHMLTGAFSAVPPRRSGMPVASVGDTAESAVTVTEETIEAYADLSGDDNPIHRDPEYASETMFGGRIAHGMLSAGPVSAALADLPGDIIYLSQDLTFENPVYPGDGVTRVTPSPPPSKSSRTSATTGFASRPPPRPTKTPSFRAKPSCSPSPTSPDRATAHRPPPVRPLHSLSPSPDPG
jgi:acyl dehydratase